ncbi:hypothetical protein ACWEOE_38480 [Amycolatopsis sp. NPDC004368]
MTVHHLNPETTPADLVVYTSRVVDSSPGLIEPIFARRVFGAEYPKVAGTWVGVSSLGLPAVAPAPR